MACAQRIQSMPRPHSPPLPPASARLTSRLAGVLLAVSCMPVYAQSASPSVVRGKALFESICVRCHSLDENRAAPALRTVVGRTAGKYPDYFYSEALESATHVWDRAKLKAWLTDPEKVVPGQEMKFHLDKDRDRDDVVAYLVSLSRSRSSKSPSPTTKETYP